MNLKTIQETLPWGAHDYTKEFNERTDPARDFEHAFGHMTEAQGKVFAAVIDKAAHEGRVDREAAEKALADVIICATRMANTCPSGAIDLAAAVEARLAVVFPDHKLGLRGWFVWTDGEEQDGGVWCEAESAAEAIAKVNGECGCSAEDGCNRAKPMTREEYDALPED